MTIKPPVSNQSKCQALRCRLQDLRPHRVKIGLLAYGNSRNLSHLPMLMQCFLHLKKQHGSLVKKFLYLELPRNAIMLQHLIASAYIVSALLFVKWWLRKFQTFSF